MTAASCGGERNVASKDANFMAGRCFFSETVSGPGTGSIPRFAGSDSERPT